MIDTEGSGSLLYLPIDKLLEQNRRAPRVTTGETTMTLEPPEPNDTTSVTGERRTRGTR